MAVISQGMGLVNFEVFAYGTDRLLGTATVELPTLEFETVDVKGAGVMGTIAYPLAPNLGSLELKLTWRSMEPAAAELAGHKSIDLSLYSVQEHYDAGTGEITDPQHRIETRVVPKTLNLGKWEPSSTVDSESTFEIITLSYFIDGVSMLELDKLNYVYKAKGKDYGAPIRKGLGI